MSAKRGASVRTDRNRRYPEEIRVNEANLSRAEILGNFGYWDWDLTTNKLKWSDGHFRIFGYPVEHGSVTYEKFRARVHPDDIDGLENIFREGTLRDANLNWDFRLVWPDGSVRYVHAEADRPVKDESGQPVRWFGIVQDVTERKRAEEALKESEDRFRTLADNIPNLVWMANADGSIFWFNKQWFDYTGTSLEEMQGWGWQKVHHPDYVRTVIEKWKSHIESGMPHENMALLRGKDGNYRWFLTRVTPLRDEKGMIKRWFGTNTDITERKRDEEALRQSEAMLAKSQQMAHIGSWIWDVETGGINRSDESYRILGLAPGEYIVTYEMFLGFIVPEDREQVANEIRSCVEDGKPYNITYRIRRKDGEIRILQSWGEPIKDASGRVVQMHGTNQDITERKRAEDALRESEEKFRGLTETAPAAICILQDGKFQYINNATETITGYARNDLLSIDFFSLIHPDNRMYVAGLYGDWLNGRIRHARFEAKIVRKDCIERWIDISVGTIDYRGRPGLILTASEVTERKRAEESLRQNEERLRMIIDTSPVPMVVFKGKQIDFVNKKFVETFGYTIDDIPTLDYWWPLAYPDEEYRKFVVQRWDAAIGPAIKNRTSTEPREVTVRCKDGSKKHILSYFSSIGDLNLSVFHDITERKLIEDALKQAKQQAEIYVDLMGHDINNLNHSAMGYLEMAMDIMESEKRLRLDDKMLIERPMNALASSSALIDNVRKLQRLMTEGVKTMPTDLDKIFRELGAVDFHLLDRDVLISTPHVSGVTVEANELLKDVFVNLISNAIKHSDEGKPLTVNVKVEPASQNGRKYYLCVVEDDGPGIPDELKGKLFHRFQRGATKAYGKGLGLYLVRTLVEGYGGKVWVEDRVPGDYKKGARFIVLLPAVE